MRRRTCSRRFVRVLLRFSLTLLAVLANSLVKGPKHTNKKLLPPRAHRDRDRFNALGFWFPPSLHNLVVLLAITLRPTEAKTSPKPQVAADILLSAAEHPPFVHSNALQQASVMLLYYDDTT